MSSFIAVLIWKIIDKLNPMLSPITNNQSPTINH